MRFRTRHELALEMLDEQGGLLPHAWVAGDDEMGRCSWFRQELRSRGEAYLLAVPSNTLVRDLVAPEPAYSRPGPHAASAVRRVRTCGARPCRSEAWETVEVRDGEKGPLVVQAAWTLVQAQAEGRASDVAESLVVFRERQGDGTWKHDYLLSNAVRGDRWRSSPGCSRRSTGSRSASSGPRRRRGWGTTRCGRGRAGITTRHCRCWRPGSSPRKPGGEKIRTPALTVPQVRVLIAGMLNRALGCQRLTHIRRTMQRRLDRNEGARLYHWMQRKRLPPRRFNQRT